MKKLLIALAAVLVTVATHAQGTVVFNNRVAAFSVDAPVVHAGTATGVGLGYSAGLYLGSGDSAVLVPESVTTFRDGSANPLFSKYINGLTVILPGTTAGQQNVTVEMRAWLTADGSYANSLSTGSSGPLVIATLGGGPDPTANNNFPATFTGFEVITIPEPSTLALGALGAAALLFRRRK